MLVRSALALSCLAMTDPRLLREVGDLAAMVAI